MKERIGSVIPDDRKFWLVEDIFRIYVNAHPVDRKDFPVERSEHEDYGMPVDFTTLGMIREKFGTKKVITVLCEGPLHGKIYQTGNYPRETAWRLHGITMGYA